MNIKLLDGSGSPEARTSPDIGRRFQATFYNTGNVLFFDALRHHVPRAVPVYDWSDLADSDTIILSMANFINPFTDVSVEYRTLKSSSAGNIVLVGCGAQAHCYDDEFALRADTLDFLSIVSERSKSIGVRGEFTAELLCRNGVKNVRIIGCPSFFRYLGNIPSVRAPIRPQRISIGATPSGNWRESTCRLFEFGMRHHAEYVVQSESHVLAAFASEPSELQKEKFDFFRHYYCPSEVSPDEFGNWLRRASNIFFSYDEWLMYMKTRDLYISTRIHGAVAAIHGGCPALVLACDTRTLELCEYFNIPCIGLQDFDPNAPVEYYADLADFQNFFSTYQSRFASYAAFMQENDLGDLGAPSAETACRPTLTSGTLGDVVRTRRALQLAQDAQADPAFVAADRKPVELPRITVVSVETSALDSVKLEKIAAPDRTTIMTTKEDDEQILRKELLSAKAVFQNAALRYTQVEGRVPEFILGENVKATCINNSKLQNAKLLSRREDILDDMLKEGHVAEVGTQRGQLAKLILSRFPKIHLHTIDINYSLFDRVGLQPFIDEARLTTVEALSWDGLAKYEPDFFQWIYIDASHFYDHVKADLEIAKSRVCVGGTILCNDYTNWSPFEVEPYGVMQAVNEFLEVEDFVVTHFAFHPFGYHDIALRRCS